MDNYNDEKQMIYTCSFEKISVFISIYELTK